MWPVSIRSAGKLTFEGKVALVEDLVVYERRTGKGHIIFANIPRLIMNLSLFILRIALALFKIMLLLKCITA